MTIDPPGPPRTTGFDSELAIIAETATTWRLTAPLVWAGTQGDTFTVPAGFITDFASVPRFLHWLVSPYGAYTRAAVLHDWLLTELADEYNQTPPANSRDCDGIFRRVMQDLGVSGPKRWIMWAAVRSAALFNRRRAWGRQFGKDAPKVLVIFVVAAPIILPGAIGVLISLAPGAIGVLISLALARPFAGRKPQGARHG